MKQHEQYTSRLTSALSCKILSKGCSFALSAAHKPTHRASGEIFYGACGLLVIKRLEAYHWRRHSPSSLMGASGPRCQKPARKQGQLSTELPSLTVGLLTPSAPQVSFADWERVGM